LVSGGIAFATPPHYGPPATNGTVFTLNEKEDPAWKDWNPLIPLASMPKKARVENPLPQIKPQTNSKSQ
jgi:paraquat-inducible protein B